MAARPPTLLHCGAAGRGDVAGHTTSASWPTGRGRHGLARGVLATLSRRPADLGSPCKGRIPPILGLLRPSQPAQARKASATWTTTYSLLLMPAPPTADVDFSPAVAVARQAALLGLPTVAACLATPSTGAPLQPAVEAAGKAGTVRAWQASCVRGGPRACAAGRHNTAHSGWLRPLAGASLAMQQETTFSGLSGLRTACRRARTVDLLSRRCLSAGQAWRAPGLPTLADPRRPSLQPRSWRGRRACCSATAVGPCLPTTHAPTSPSPLG